MKKYAHSFCLRVLVCLLVYVFVNQSNAHAGLTFGSMKADRILYLGNSITRHGPKPSIGWNYDWGMAATAEEKDYVHVLTNSIAQVAGGMPSIMTGNLGDFEVNYATNDNGYDINTALPDQMNFQADIVVVAIGENVRPLNTPELKAKYQSNFLGLLEDLKANGNPTIFVRSCFWSNIAKDLSMLLATTEADCQFVNIAQLDDNPLNFALAEGHFTHEGVNLHPGDVGMTAIANEIFEVMEAYAFVPEPGSIALLATGMIFLSGWRLRRRALRHG